MRTLTTTSRIRPARTRFAAAGLTAAAAMALAGCGSSGSVKAASTSSAPVASSTPSAQKTFDPAQGPTQGASTLPKNCDGLVTDADVQLVVGQPLAGGDVWTGFQPNANVNQTGRVLCQYGVVLDSNTGKFQSDQLEVQMATYTDGPSAASRASSTVAGMAAKNAAYKQVSVSGHPATLVTETTDTVLVMYDGNRTFVITIQAALAKGDQAGQIASKLADALYKHTLPAAPSSAGSSPAASGSGTASGTPVSGSPSSPSGTPGTPASS